MRTLFSLMLITIAVGFSSCFSYKPASLSGNDFLHNKKVFQHTGHYDIYVHQDNRLWKMRDAKLDIQGNLKGKLVELNDPLPHEIALPTDLKNNEEANNDVHLRLNPEVKMEERIAGDSIHFTERDLRYVEMSKRSSEGRSTGTTVVLWILGILGALAAILIIAFIVAIRNVSANGCFVASMAYEDSNAPQVNEFRKFRDKHLLTNKLGRALVVIYYHFSPIFVKRFGQYPGVRRLSRSFLDCLLVLIRPFL